MKIRNGFVSNSSSSSFVLDGSKKEVQEILSQVAPHISRSISDLGRHTVVETDVENVLKFWLQDDYVMEQHIEDIESAMRSNDISYEDVVYVRISDQEDNCLFAEDHEWYIVEEELRFSPHMSEDDLLAKVQRSRKCIEGILKRYREDLKSKYTFYVCLAKEQIPVLEEALKMTDQEVIDMCRRIVNLDKEFEKVAISLGEYH